MIIDKNIKNNFLSFLVGEVKTFPASQRLQTCRVTPGRGKSGSTFRGHGISRKDNSGPRTGDRGMGSCRSDDKLMPIAMRS